MNLRYTKSFRRDYKVLCRRKWDIGRLNSLIDYLALTDNSYTLKGNFLAKESAM